MESKRSGTNLISPERTTPIKTSLRLCFFPCQSTAGLLTSINHCSRICGSIAPPPRLLNDLLCTYPESVLTSSPFSRSFSIILGRASSIPIPVNSCAIGSNLPSKSIIGSFSKPCRSAIPKST